MAIRSSNYYERQAEEAKKRETYFRTRPPRPANSTVVQREPTVSVLYRSMLIKQDGDPAIFSVDVDSQALADVGGTAKCGLLAALPTPEAGSTAQNTPLRLRGSGMKPTRAHWYKGVATPTVAQSKWGTNWTKYYETKSHKSVPMSTPSGTTVAIDQIRALFDAIFTTTVDGATKANTTLLGTKNGRAYLEFERAAFARRS
jgi:hypothetical protein